MKSHGQRIRVHAYPWESNLGQAVIGVALMLLSAAVAVWCWL